MSSFKDDYSLLSSNVSALLTESTSTVITNIIGSDFRPGLGNFVSFFFDFWLSARQVMEWIDGDYADTVLT